MSKYLPLFLSVAVALLVCAGCKPQSATAASSSPSTSAASLPRLNEVLIGTGDSVDAQHAGGPLQQGQPIAIALQFDRPTLESDVDARVISLADGHAVGQLHHKLASGQSALHAQFSSDETKAWAPGRYLLEIKLGGKLAGQRDIDIAPSDPVVDESKAKPAPSQP